jgi:nucleoside-diphosphate-sugar epimerase
MPLLSPRKTIECFIHAHELASSAWGTNRTLMLPSLDMTVGDMAEAVKRVAGNDAYKKIVWKADPQIQKIVDGWPARLDSRRARGMGLKADASMDAIIQAFIEDDLRPS